MAKKSETEKILESIPMAKMTKKGFAFKMSKNTDFEMNQKLKKQDTMYG